MLKNSRFDIINERRRKIRFESSLKKDDSNSQFKEELETASLDEIIGYFQSEDPNIILPCLEKLSYLIKQNDDINFLLGNIYQLINYLNIFAEMDDKIDENDINKEKITSMSDLSMNILDQIFSFEIEIPENPSKTESFFSFYIDQNQTFDVEQMGTCFSVISKMIPDLTYKKLFFNSECFDFIIQIPKLQLPPIYLQSITSIISTCIKQDFNISLEGPTKLLSQLTIILENYQNYDSTILDICAQGCYNYVSIVSDTIDSTVSTSLFIASDSHIRLINALTSMSDLGICYSISALGKCFYSSIPNAILSPNLMNIFGETENEEMEFNIESKIIDEIPIEIFKDSLELTDELARADAVLALCNVMVKVNLIIEPIFKSGLFESLMNHLITDNFNIRVSMLKVFISIFVNVSQSSLPLFINEQFFQTVEELVESDVPEIEDLANHIYILVLSDTEHQEIINEFRKFLDSRI